MALPPFLPRVLITPTRVAVSREGVDVTNPPANTPEYLALDSDWPKVERIHTIAKITRATLKTPKTVRFTALSSQPFAFLAQKQQGVFYDPPTHAIEVIDKTLHYQTYRIEWIKTDSAQLRQIPHANLVYDLDKWNFYLVLVKP